ncbi:MAG: DMT family transporter [Alphaproteobacteria bacterium]|nr:DMT family transporter [Alphaproteobacteria bacterium]
MSAAPPPPPARGMGAWPVPVRAALWMFAFAAGAASANLCTRYASQTLPVVVVVFWRNVLSILVLSPVIARGALGAVSRRRFWLYVARSLTQLLTIYLWFAGLALMPIDRATALNFTAPIFATLGAALVLRERIDGGRWAAVIVGFLGSAIIVRPGLASFEPVALLPIGAAVMMAAVMLMLKALARTEPPGTIVLMMTLIMTPVSLPPALMAWQWPTAMELLATFGLATMSVIGQVCASRAFALADAGFVAPFDFARLPFGACLGWLAFGEVMDGWSWLGAVVIFAATMAIARREARMKSVPQRGA